MLEKKGIYLGAGTTAMVMSPLALAATDLASAVTELKGTFAAATAPALDFVTAGLGFMLAPKILVKIFYIIF